MTSRDFCYWLQGYLELTNQRGGMNEEQLKCIQKHLSLVFKHEIDPSMGDAKEQANLNKVHNTGQNKSGRDLLLRC